MSVHYGRAELQAIIAARHGQPEAVGTGSVMEFRIKVTPELLEKMLGGYFVWPDGRRARFAGVAVDGDYAEPWFEEVSPPPTEQR